MAEQIKNDPLKFAGVASHSRVFWFYLGVKIGMTLAFTNNKRKDLGEEEKDKVNLWPLDMAQRIVQENWNSERIQQRHVRIINEAPLPEQETKFFRIISNSLNEAEEDVWDYIYRLLTDYASGTTKALDLYQLEYESGVPQETAYSALLHLQKLGVIEFHDDSSRPNKCNTQPIVIKRGAYWIDNNK